jgi:phosphoesterase RecJ-like protein
MYKESVMKKFLEEFQNSERILITGHINPDGDCIGSGLALMLALNKLNKDNKKVVRFVLDDEAPSTTDFMKHSLLIEKYEYFVSKYTFDMAIILDCGAYDRIGNVKELIKDNTKVINIDHHISNNSFGHLNYLDSSKSSTAEIIYEMIEEFEIEMDSDIGEALYVGLVNDTGNFSYNNVSPRTFEIASKLRSIGVDNEKIIREFYSKKNMARLRLLGYAMENFKFDNEKKLAYIYISKEVMDKHQGKKEDTEGVVEALRSYQDAEIALFIREEEDGNLKGSMRSNGYDVNEIAKTFGGGGHIKAAGFTSNMTVDEIISKVLKMI